MGAWTTDALGNDDACDWVLQLDTCNDLSLVEQTLDRVLEQADEYIESPEACEALAAIEVIARLQGTSDALTAEYEPIDAWVKAHPITLSKALAEKAHRVIARVLADDSELKELWQESDEFDQWVKDVQHLASRVRM